MKLKICCCFSESIRALLVLILKVKTAANLSIALSLSNIVLVVLENYKCSFTAVFFFWCDGGKGSHSFRPLQVRLYFMRLPWTFISATATSALIPSLCGAQFQTASSSINFIRILYLFWFYDCQRHSFLSCDRHWWVWINNPKVCILYWVCVYTAKRASNRTIFVS